SNRTLVTGLRPVIRSVEQLDASRHKVLLASVEPRSRKLLDQNLCELSEQLDVHVILIGPAWEEDRVSLLEQSCGNLGGQLRCELGSAFERGASEAFRERPL